MGVGCGCEDKINGHSPNLSQLRVKTLLNSSRADALPNQPASLSLIFYLASSSDMSSNAHRTHQVSTACQHINQAPLSPACLVCREWSVKRIKLLLSPTSQRGECRATKWCSDSKSNTLYCWEESTQKPWLQMHLYLFKCLFKVRRSNNTVSKSIIKFNFQLNLTLLKTMQR